MKNSPGIIRSLRIASILAAASISSLCAGGTFTWEGDSGANVNWSDAANWSAAPTSDSTTIMVFNINATPPTNYYNPVVDAPWTLNQLTMTTNASSGTKWNFTGSALTFAGTGAAINVTMPSNANSSVGNVIANNIVLNTNLSVTVGTSSYAAELSLNGIISGNYALTMVSTLGTLRLNGDNSFTQGFTMSRGNLYIGHNNALGTGVFTMAGGGQSYAIYAPNTRTLGNAIVIGTGDGSARFSGNQTYTGNITLGNTANPSAQARIVRPAQGANLVFSGNISSVAGATGNATNFYISGTAGGSEGGSVANAKDNRITLSGNALYTGKTIVGNTLGTAVYGTAFVNGNFGSTSETLVYNGMVLRGTGTVSRTTINAGAILAPGGTASSATTLGTLHVVGDVTLDGADDGLNNAAFRVNMTGGVSPASDKVAITGTDANFNIADNVTLTLTLTGGVLQAPVVIATWADAVTAGSYGSFASITLNGTTTEWENSGYSISYGANSITVIPEPRTLALLILGGLGLVIFRRRRICQA